jgi:hypothetical protein
VLSVLLSFSFDHCVIKKKTEGQITQWPKEKDRTDITMDKRNRQKDK